MRSLMRAATIWAVLTGATTARAAVDYQLVEGPTDLRIETARYTLVVTRQGFGWSLLRGGAPVLQSAAPGDPAPNGTLLIEGKLERPTALTSVARSADGVVLEYGASRKKTALRVE